MGKVTDIPENVSNAGQDANYATPFPTADIVLVNAPLDADYHNIALNAGVVDAYIEGEINAGRAFAADTNWIAPDRPIDLAIAFAGASRFNYARASVGGRNFYMFVTVEFVNANTTRFNPTIDSWTTYGPRIGYSYVERGHVAVAAAVNAGINSTRYTQAPEPVEVGELVTVASDTWNPFGDVEVFVLSTVNLNSAGWLNAYGFVTGSEDVLRDYTPLNMEALTQVQPQLSDSGTAGGTWRIGTYWSGTIESGGSWPFPPNSATAIAGYQMGDIAREPMTYPWTGTSNGRTVEMVPSAGTLSSLARPDGMLAGGDLFHYDSVEAYASHMSAISFYGWVAKHIQAVFVVPRGVATYTLGPSSGGTEPSVSAIIGGTGNADTAADHLNARRGHAHPVRSISFSDSSAVTLIARDAWRSLYNPGQWLKLASDQNVAVTLTNRDGSEVDTPTRSLGSRVEVRGKRSAYQEFTASAWVNTPGADANPVTVSCGISLPRFQSGANIALSEGARGLVEARKQAVMRYNAEVWNASFARYGALAQDGFPTVLQRAVGNALGAGF